MEVDGEEAVVLVDIRAGLMTLQNGLLGADPRKGLLRVTKGEDMLTHVAWYERQGVDPAGDPQLDTVVFPGECSLQQIPNQPRCYVLKFPEDPSRDTFFWLQQAKPHEDGAYIARFNAAVNDQELPSLPTPPAAVATQPASSNNNNAIAQSLAAALQQVTAGAGSSSSGQTGAPDATALAVSLLSQLAAQQGRRVRAPVDEGPGLHEVLKPELLIPLVQQQPEVLEQLAPHLPEEHRDMQQLIATLRSPQFRQQVATFSVALQTGQLNLAQFGLQAKGFSVADFLEAVQEAADKEKQQQQ